MNPVSAGLLRQRRFVTRGIARWFLDRVENRSGFRIEVLEAIEETRLIYQLTTHYSGRSCRPGASCWLGLGAGEHT